MHIWVGKGKLKRTEGMAVIVFPLGRFFDESTPNGIAACGKKAV